MLPNLEIEQEIECPTMYSFHHSYFSGSTRMRKGGEYENEQRRQAEKLIKELRFGCTTNIAMVINYYPKEYSMLSLACRDIGIMDCEYVARGETEEEFWREAAEHIIKVHGTEDADITPQFKESYKRYIKYS